MFRDADLRGANFFDADLTGANFAGAQLQGASFALARGVPVELEPFLDTDRRCESAAPAPGPAHARSTQRAVFLSLPSHRTAAQETVCDRITTLLRREGYESERLPRVEYPPSDAFSEIYRRMSGCVGVIAFGMRQSQDADGESAGATPWTHVEAGMAYACNLPLLIAREASVNSGAFDDSVVGHRTFMLNVDGPWDDDAIVRAMRPWLAQLAAS